MKVNKPKFWNRPIGIFSLLLLPFSLITVIIIYIKKKLTNTQKFNIPIVCPDNVGQANDLIYNGSNGYTYKQGNIDELTSKIDKALIIS